jgi:hypothetical protein
MKHTAAAGGQPAAAAMLAQRPNETRVRGAGPARKTFLRPKTCKAPHPLQPIVRPRVRVGKSTLADSRQVTGFQK